MTLSSTGRGDDPFGGEDDVTPLDQIAGRQRPPIDNPDGRFEAGSKMNFSGEVAEQFEALVIATQIPGYDEMRHRLLNAAIRFVSPEIGTQFVDLGTSNGRMIRDVIGHLAHTKDHRLAASTFVGLDYEQDMLDVAETRLEKLRQDPEVIAAGKSLRDARILSDSMDIPEVIFQYVNLKNGLPPLVHNASVIASVFTVQFIPIEHRPKLLKQVYDRLIPGGAFLWAEKVLLPGFQLDSLFSEMYYADKMMNGLSVDAVVNKRRSLEGYLMPLTTNANLELLTAAGFKPALTTVIWKNLQFEAYIAVKEK